MTVISFFIGYQQQESDETIERGRSSNSWHSVVSPYPHYSNEQTNAEESSKQQQQFSLVSSSDDNTSLKKEPTSQNVPIPDCPTPDSVHSGMDSVAACSISSPSPVVTSGVDATTTNADFSYNDGLCATMRNNPLSVGMKPQINDATYLTNQFLSSRIAASSSEELYNPILSTSPPQQGLANAHNHNQFSTSLYGGGEHDGDDSNAYLKANSLRSKGLCQYYYYIYLKCDFMKQTQKWIN